jgi:beta-lactamase class A
MKKKRSVKRWLVVAVALVWVAIAGVQLAWDSNKFRPGTVILGVEVAGRTVDEVREQLAAELRGRRVIVQTEDGTEMTAVGVDETQIRLEDTLKEDVAYSLPARLIPGTLWLGKVWQRETVPVTLDAEAVVSAISTEPVEGWALVTNDGAEGREARTGFTFDAEKLKRRLTEVGLGVHDAVIEVAATAQAPKKSPAEMATLADELAETHDQVLERFRGTSLGVMAVDLDGYWELGINQDRVYTSASTYKLFIAYTMLRQVEDGKASWADQLNGKSLEACLETMIVDSDNACPETWLIKMGYSWVRAQVAELEWLKGTKIADGDMQTTPRDLATLLTKLYDGELLSTESTEKLLGLMKRQKYRDGIPAGVAPAAVADKVGFLGGLLHDAAIVYGERPMVLVVMTNGSSWQNIAQIAGDIQSFALRD